MIPNKLCFFKLTSFFNCTFLYYPPFKSKLLTVLDAVPNLFLGSLSTISTWIISCLPYFMTCENYRTSFHFLPSNPFTYCKATLVRIVDNVQHKNLGRQTNRRSSPMELAPTPSWYQGRGGKFGCLCQEVRGPFRALSSWAEKEFCHQRKVTRWWMAPQWTPKNFPPPIFHQRIWVQIFFCAVLVIQESFF